MYLLHSLKPGTLKYIIDHNGLKKFHSRYSQRSGVWFSALPELTNRINAVDNIWNENIMFFNRGPVLVFKNNLFDDHKFDIEMRSKCGGRNPISCESLYTNIDEFYNHTDNECVKYGGSSRWFHSHQIVTDNFVSLDRLHCILVYTDHHYKEIRDCYNSECIKSVVDYMDISKNPLSFSDLYSIIHPRPCKNSYSIRLSTHESEKSYSCTISNKYSRGKLLI